jgi:hypothetical protein
VSGNAQVYEDALLYGNAQVHGDAWVSGDAHVSGNAKVYGNAQVAGVNDILVVGPAKSSGRYTTAVKDREIGVRVCTGCFSGTVNEFRDQIESKHTNNPVYLKQYRAFHTLIVSNFSNEE